MKTLRNWEMRPIERYWKIISITEKANPMTEQEREERYRLQVMLAAGALPDSTSVEEAVERIVALGRKELDK